MNPINIAVDTNIPLGEDFFSSLGNVVPIAGRTVTSAELQAVDVLIVRSTTVVNEKLLCNTPVKFVATCTAGYDHFDTDWLTKNQIVWKHAPGCNASSVVQFVIASLCAQKINWLNKTVGIVGCGEVGGLLNRTLENLDVTVCCYDPFLHHWSNLTTLTKVLASDIVCLHTPLTTTGPYPTYHLIAEAELRKLKPGAVLINAGRGGVVNEAALKQRLQSGIPLTVVMDVWEGEPDIDTELLPLVAQATPHIAGHSTYGKVRGTEIAYRECCRFLKLEPSLGLSDFMSVQIKIMQPSSLADAVLAIYNPLADHQQIMTGIHDNKNMALLFDQLRKNYPPRLEFFNAKLDSGLIMENEMEHKLKNLGFQFVE